MIEPSVLILASRFDLTCDFVVSALRRLGTKYIRLNTEDLPEISISLDPKRTEIRVKMGGNEFRLSENNVRSVFYRRPVFLRDYGGSPLSPLEQFKRHQWATFIRNFIILRNACWMNHPAATYVAEHKAYQLTVANDIGFDIPETIVANSLESVFRNKAMQHHVAVKGIDTVMVRDGESETFGYTTLTKTTELSQDQVQAAPVVFQEALKHKLDLRVTVVGPDVFAVSITKGGKRIEGDWRCEKTEAHFEPYELPEEVRAKCRNLVSELKLTFGAIDLALGGKSFYFLEINPTGEWGWLVDAAGLAIDESVAVRLADTSWCKMNFGQFRQQKHRS